MTEKDFTTGEVARALQCSLGTVRKLSNRNQLREHRLPLSKKRRFRRRDVIAFLRENGMPLGKLERRLVLLSEDPELIRRVEDDFREDGVTVAFSAFSAGIEVAHDPEALPVLLIDEAAEQARDVLTAASQARTEGEGVMVPVVLLTDWQVSETVKQSANVRAVLPRAFEPCALKRSLAGVY